MTRSEYVKKTLSELTGGESDFLAELTEAYLENFEEFKVDATQAVQKADMKALHEHLHKVKPSFITFGAVSEYEELHKIMDTFSPDREQIYIKQISEISDSMIAALNAVL